MCVCVCLLKWDRLSPKNVVCFIYLKSVSLLLSLIVNEIHGATHKSMKTKLYVHIKRNLNSPECQCVVGQRSAMHQTSEMVTSILYGVSERPTRIGLVVSL